MSYGIAGPRNWILNENDNSFKNFFPVVVIERLIFYSLLNSSSMCVYFFGVKLRRDS